MFLLPQRSNSGSLRILIHSFNMDTKRKNNAKQKTAKESSCQWLFSFAPPAFPPVRPPPDMDCTKNSSYGCFTKTSVSMRRKFLVLAAPFIMACRVPIAFFHPKTGRPRRDGFSWRQSAGRCWSFVGGPKHRSPSGPAAPGHGPHPPVLVRKTPTFEKTS